MQKRIPVPNVPEYLKLFPAPMQARLRQLRKLIQKAAPEAEESISYQIPTYKLNSRPLLYFAAFENHVSLYPVSDRMVKAIKEVGHYRTGKGTLQFPNSKPLPLGLIKKIVKFKLEENESLYGKKKLTKKGKK